MFTPGGLTVDVDVTVRCLKCPHGKNLQWEHHFWVRHGTRRAWGVAQVLYFIQRLIRFASSFRSVDIAIRRNRSTKKAWQTTMVQIRSVLWERFKLQATRSGWLHSRLKLQRVLPPYHKVQSPPLNTISIITTTATMATRFKIVKISGFQDFKISRFQYFQHLQDFKISRFPLRYILKISRFKISRCQDSLYIHVLSRFSDFTVEEP